MGAGKQNLFLWAVRFMKAGVRLAFVGSMRLKVVCILWVSVVLVCGSLVAAERVLTGSIEGALYTVRVPEVLSGDLLLVAHGYRPQGSALSADFEESAAMYDSMVADGWVVATTSYRRNGWVLQDAAADLLNLRAWIVAEVLEPKRVFLLGSSMGGGVVTWLAEQAPEGFDGAVAQGAYLFEPIVDLAVRSNQFADFYTFEPKLPLLYLTNQSELAGPAGYVERARTSEVPPVLWTVKRDGHVNLNGAETLAALRAVMDATAGGVLVANADATKVVDPESRAQIEDGVLHGVVSSVVPIFGNLTTYFVQSDLAEIGIEKGAFFELSAGGATVSVLLGSTYRDVDVGEWVAFWDAENYLLISRNYADAGKTLGVNKGAALQIRASGAGE